MVEITFIAGLALALFACGDPGASSSAESVTSSTSTGSGGIGSSTGASSSAGAPTAGAGLCYLLRPPFAHDAVVALPDGRVRVLLQGPLGAAARARANAAPSPSDAPATTAHGLYLWTNSDAD